MHRDNKILLNHPPQERTPLLLGNLYIAEGAALQRGNYCMCIISQWKRGRGVHYVKLYSDMLLKWVNIFSFWIYIPYYWVINFPLQCICAGADPGFQVRGGGHIKKNCAEWREARKILGYFVWKITILRQKIIFFPILGSAPGNIHWGKADDRNCNYGHPKMADVESGKNLFCRLNCFYNVF